MAKKKTAKKKVVKKKTAKKKAVKKKVVKKTSTPSQKIRGNVRTVLKKKAKEFPSKNPYLTAYQILELLPNKVRDRLIRTHGIGGKNSGDKHPSTRVVSDAASYVATETVYLNTNGVSFEIKGSTIFPSRKYCGLFRIIR